MAQVESPAVVPTGAQSKPGVRSEAPEGKEELKALIKAILEFAPIRTLVDTGKRSGRYRRFLNTLPPSKLKFRGVFSSFEEARAHVHPGTRLGYDHAEIARIYEGYADFVLSGDYPVLLWLRELLETSRTVFDFGGNIGISFYAFENYISYPPSLVWTVCDLPAVLQAGQELAQQRRERRLQFSGSFEHASGCDVLLTSGCLMYVEQSLVDLLRRLPQLPKHLLINRTAVHQDRSCVTIQNIRWMASPYHVFSRSEFIQGLQRLGYSLVDEWTDATHLCWIPFYPEFSVPAYTGMYLKL